MWAPSLSQRKLWTADNLPGKDSECQRKLAVRCLGEAEQLAEIGIPYTILQPDWHQRGCQKKGRELIIPCTHQDDRKHRENDPLLQLFLWIRSPWSEKREVLSWTTLHLPIQLSSWTISLFHQTGKLVIHKNCAPMCFQFLLVCTVNLVLRQNTWQ